MVTEARDEAAALRAATTQASQKDAAKLQAVERQNQLLRLLRTIRTRARAGDAVGEAEIEQAMSLAGLDGDADPRVTVR